MQHEDNKKPAMEVRNLFFSYGKNKVLKDTSFKIEEGKITTIMGANGCGKSTLFNLMTKNFGKYPSYTSTIPRQTISRWNGWSPSGVRPT